MTTIYNILVFIAAVSLVAFLISGTILVIANFVIVPRLKKKR